MAGISPVLTFCGQERVLQSWRWLGLASRNHQEERGFLLVGVIKFKMLFVVRFDHESGMEEGSALGQCLHFLGNPSGPVLALAQPSLPQPLGGASFPPWSSNLRCCLLPKKFVFNHENGVKEGPVLDQCLHFLENPSGHLGMISAMLAANTRRTILASLVIEVQDCVGFQKLFHFLA